MRKSERSNYHFNYFSVDYQEELSALYGPFLNQQTEYLSHCITRILQCYSHLKEKPISVIAVGHSMGGLVIRGLFSQPNFNPNLISTIINLATPQTKPVLSLDPELYSYYELLNNYWLQYAEKTLQNVSVVSLGGGTRDNLVPSNLCTLDDISTNPHHVNMLTTNIPLVWRSTDHQCIVWCNELVRFETHMLFQMIDKKTGFITNNHTFRGNLVQKLFKNTDYLGTSRLSTVDCNVVHLNNTIIMLTTEKKACYLLKRNPDTEQYSLSILVEDKVEDWAFICENFLTCQSIDSTEILPSIKNNIAQSFLKADISNETIIMLKFSKEVTFHVQFNEDIVEIQLPYLFTKELQNFHQLFYLEFDIPFFTETWQVYDITVVYMDKQQNDKIIGNLKSPWYGESEYLTTSNPGDIFLLKLFHQKPDVQNPDHVKLRFWGNNLMDLKFVVKFNLIGSFGQLLRLHAEMLLRCVLLFCLFNMFCHVYLEQCHKQTISRINFSKNYVVMLLFISLTLILTLFLVDVKISFTVKRLFPQVFMIILSFFTSEVLRIVLRVAAIIMMILLHPASCIIQWVESILTCLKLEITSLGIKIGSYHFTLLLPVILAYCMKCLNLNILLMLLLCYHILKINITQDIISKELQLEILLGVFPVILVFNIVPVIIFIKDYVDGSHQTILTFWNVQLLTFGYVIYLSTDFESYSNLDKAFKGKWDLAVAIIHFIFTVLMFVPSLPLYLVTCLCFFQLSFIVFVW